MTARGASADTIDRALSAAEVAERDVLRPALAAWSAYLMRVGRVGTLDQAVANLAPLEGAAGLGAFSLEWPMAFAGYVNPRLALSAQRGRPDLDPAVTPAMMVESIAWMGARPPATMAGRDEHDRRSPHRDPVDWYRVSAEMVGRLMMGWHVPVLTGLTGRSRGVVISESTRRAARARAALWIDPDTMVGVVKAFCQTGEPTSLFATAVAENRPLVLRGRGRPGRGGHGTLDLDTAAVSPHAVGTLVRTDGPRLKVPALPAEAVVEVLARMAQAYPQIAAPMDRARPVDAGRQVRVTGWLRVSLAGLGLPAWPREPLASEIINYRYRDYRTGSTVQPHPTTSGEM